MVYKICNKCMDSIEITLFADTNKFCSRCGSEMQFIKSVNGVAFKGNRGVEEDG